MLLVSIFTRLTRHRLACNVIAMTPTLLVFHNFLLKEALFNAVLHAIKAVEDLLLTLGASLVDLGHQLDVVGIPVTLLCDSEDV